MARCLAMALSCLCLVAQLASSAHLYMVRHTLCPEDGELVHTSGAVPTRAAAFEPGETSLLSTSSAGTGHEHEHCFLASHRTQSVARNSRFAVALPPPAVAEPCHALSPSGRVSSVALLLLAPKTSPPICT